MPAGYPVKVNYLTGDVLTAANLNDLAGTVNFYDPTAKGDLFPASAADAVSRLAVGANNTVLTADSAAATGMKWAAGAAAVSGLNIVQAETAFTSVAAITADGVFTSSYQNYIIIYSATGASGASTTLQLRVSGTASSANYNRQLIDINDTSVSAYKNINQANYDYSQVYTTVNSVVLNLFRPALAAITMLTSVSVHGPSATSFAEVLTGGNHNVATAYDGIAITFGSNSTGTYTIYGYGK